MKRMIRTTAVITAFMAAVAVTMFLCRVVAYVMINISETCDIPL